MTDSGGPGPALREFVRAQGLAAADDDVRWEALTGGVSSDIWKVESPRGVFCVKAALPKLKVASEWRAPIDRNAHEWDWLCFAHARRPGSVPRPVAHDPRIGAFAMEFLDPRQHPVWKRLLLDGRIDAAFAAAVARGLALLHRASAGRADLRERFATLDTFHAIRLEPYLVATARAHPSVQPQIERLVDELSASSIALVHGDVSPKNILVGPRGPVFLDAECAWFGDPAFDAAFCLNHFLLKCLARRGDAGRYLDLFDTFASTYFGLADWEDARALEARVARLLPALFLARVDGKSPVEYIDREADRELVRSTALSLLARTPVEVEEIARAWRMRLSA
jgi:aminoglycoside phosphotransferase (APT) family kinase protein